MVLLFPFWSRGTYTLLYLHTDGAFRAVERQAHAVCDYVIRPNATGNGGGSSETMMNRWSGFFSTSNTAWRVWPAPCSFTFPVLPGQSVQINLLTFNITYVLYITVGTTTHIISCFLVWTSLVLVLFSLSLKAPDQTTARRAISFGGCCSSNSAYARTCRERERPRERETRQRKVLTVFQTITILYI
jgi:hypothetical protein